MFGLAHFCWSWEIPVGANLRGEESSKAAAEERWGNVALSALWKSSNVCGRNAAAAAEESSIPRPFYRRDRKQALQRLRKPHMSNSDFKSRGALYEKIPCLLQNICPKSLNLKELFFTMT